MINLKTEEEIEMLKIGGKKLAKILIDLSKEVKPGVSSFYLNDLAHKMMLDEGGQPSFLGYTPGGAFRPFPGSLCVSINEEIVHGIPNEVEKIVKEGDLVTLDAGLIYEGLFTDHAVTIMVGKVPERVKELVWKTEKALYAGIEAAQVGGHIGDIGFAISQIAKNSKLGVMRDLTGHGVGFAVHEDPYVPNYGKKGTGEKLVAGMVLAIEPMFSLGSSEIITAEDGYTYLTADGSLSAQFEHTIAITEEGPVILTQI